MSRTGALLTAAAMCAAGACGDNKTPGLAWGLGVATFPVAEVGIAATPTAAETPAWLATITATPHLDTPTYDHEDQVTHPDILVEPDRVLLAVTPYPYSNDADENPSLLVGSDGIGFQPLPGAPDPLVPPPPIDHNDDPDLRRVAPGSAYELLYLETERPAKQTVVALRSADLRTWTRRDAIVYDLAASDEFIVSPAAILDDAGVTHLFYVWLAADNRIMTLTSPDGTTWDRATEVAATLPLGDVTPWHLDVIRAGAGYAMLISGYVGADQFDFQDLYLATSADLATWTLRPEPLLRHGDLGVTSLYRSTGVVADDRLIVWYAMQY